MPRQIMPTVNLLKMPDPAAQTAKYVNMMNATKQLEAAERQAATAEKRNQREEDLQVPALAKAKTEAEVANLEYTMKFYNESANVLANARDPEQAVARGEELKQQFTHPALQKRIDETVADLVSDPSRFEENRKRILIRTLGAKEQFAETHSDIFDAEGNLYNKKTSNIGAFPTEITPGVVTGPANTGAAPAPAPRTPTAPQAAAPNPFAPGYEPNTAAAAPNSLSLVVDSALETGVMAKADFDKLVSIAQPGSGPKLEAWARQHNITIAPNAPGVTDNQVRGAPANLPSQMAVSPMSYDGRTPPSQFADMRGPAPQASFADLGGQPEMQNTMAQYQVGQQIKGRDPRMSPTPGIYNVPTGQVAATSQAQRSSPAEDAAKETARLQAAENFAKSNQDVLIDRKRQEVFAAKRAEKDAEFLETYTDTVSKSRNTLNALDQMIGDARIERDRIVIPKGGRRPHGGFEGVVGAGIPGVRFIEGTQAAGFDALLEQVQGGAFLKAFSDLRGGGAITQIEGEKATTALTRVKRAQSEVEFVKAAREFVEILRNGIKNADKRYTRLTGEAPEAAPARRRTPTKGSDGWGKAKVVGN